MPCFLIYKIKGCCLGLSAVLVIELSSLIKSLKDLCQSISALELVQLKRGSEARVSPPEAAILGGGSPKETIWKPVSNILAWGYPALILTRNNHQNLQIDTSTCFKQGSGITVLKNEFWKKNYADKLKWDTRFFLNHVNKHSRKEHLRSPKG